jgi:hypothetical protein
MRLSDWLESLSKTLWLTPEFAFLKLEAISQGKSEQNTRPHVRSKNVAPLREWVPIFKISSVPLARCLTPCNCARNFLPFPNPLR